MSVEAIRTPVMNFFVKQYERFSSININGENVIPMEADGAGYLWGLLPEGYEIVSENDTPYLKIYMYEDDTGDIVQFVVHQTDGSMAYNVDTEDAICSEVIVGDYKALLIEEEGYQVIWYDEESCTVYNLRATGFDREAFFKICNSLASFYQQKD